MSTAARKLRKRMKRHWLREVALANAYVEMHRGDPTRKFYTERGIDVAEEMVEAYSFRNRVQRQPSRRPARGNRKVYPL